MSSHNLLEPLLDRPSDGFQQPSLPQNIVILSKTIIGAGSAALPFAFEKMGFFFATGFLLLMAMMTHYSIDALAASTIVSGHYSYPRCVQDMLGISLSLLLEISLVCRCGGLMVVYLVIAADTLVGTDKLPGILPEIFGEFWDNKRALVAAIVAVILMPVVAPKRLSSSKVTSAIGLFSVGIWCFLTVILSAISNHEGRSFEWKMFPDSLSSLKDAVMLLSVVPVLATAYTCQMTVHFVMKDLRDFNQKSMSLVSAASVSICTIIFLTIAAGSVSLFGKDVPADVLEAFTIENLKAIISPRWAQGISILIRMSFLLSVLANFPMQMLPYRESLLRVISRDKEMKISQSQFLLLTFSSLWGVYVVAISARSIWIPLQLVGATAGAVIAFFFPAMLGLSIANNTADDKIGKYPLLLWRILAWSLIVLGVVQMVTGVLSVMIRK